MFTKEISFKKILFLLILLCFSITSTHLSQQLKADSYTKQTEIFQEVFQPHELVENMKLYKKKLDIWHAGDPLAHSIWVAKAISMWFDQEYHWCKGINKSDLDTAVLGGFLHDIGKFGDLSFNFVVKPNHCIDGFNYLTDKTTYFVDNYKIIAIFAGIHWGYGCIDKGQKSGEETQVLYKDFFDQLLKLVKITNYNDGKLDERIARLSILINVADIRGIQPVEYPCPILEKLLNIKDPDSIAIHKGMDAYERFQCESKGKKRKDELLEYYHKHF